MFPAACHRLSGSPMRGRVWTTISQRDDLEPTLTLVRHCAAVLSGLRPANLFSVHAPAGCGNSSPAGFVHRPDDAPRQGLDAVLSGYLAEFDGSPLSVRILCRCADHALVYLYAPDRLIRTLSEPVHADWLRTAGYPVPDAPGAADRAADDRAAAGIAALDGMLNHLDARLKAACAAGAGFPHEIGLFLGYPTEDVRGFIRYGGSKALCSGYWKVYENPSVKTAMFAEIRDWEHRLCARVRQGVRPAALIQHERPFSFCEAAHRLADA